MVLGETGSWKSASLNECRFRKQGVPGIASGRKVTSNSRRAANMSASNQTIHVQVEWCAMNLRCDYIISVLHSYGNGKRLARQ